LAIAIRLEQTGGTEVLRIQPTKDLPPGPGEVWIEQEAVGVNYLDVSQRRGDVPIPLPSGLGLEAAGRVSAIGSNVGDVTVGEHVAYILGPIELRQWPHLSV
jgi:NADPH2:quinone reductase